RAGCAARAARRGSRRSSAAARESRAPVQVVRSSYVMFSILYVFRTYPTPDGGVMSQQSFLATRRGKLTLALLAAIAFLDFVDACLAQGLGAALALPSALSILTTTFKEGADRHKALGIWGAVGGLASAAGVLLGGLLTEGPGWRWVMFVNPVAAALVLVAVFRLIDGEGARKQLHDFDVRGAILATGGMLLLVYTLVKAPTVGWGTARTIGELAGALALLAAFVINEQRTKNPLAPLSIFRINGLGYADATQLIAFAGFLALFFFLTLYMQNVLGYSAIQTGLAYLPLTFAIGIAAGISSQLLPRIGTRPVIIAGALIGAGGLYWLSRIPAHGAYLTALLPAMLVFFV